MIVAHAGTGADAATVLLVLGAAGVLVVARRRRGRARSAWTVAAAAVAVVGLTASVWVPGPSKPSARPASTAQIAVVQPAAGAVVGPDFDVTLRLRGARLAPVNVVRVVPGEGHIHLSLDGRLVAMSPGLGSSLHQVPAGPHTLSAEFVANDHASFRPPVVAAVQFSVRLGG